MAHYPNERQPKAIPCRVHFLDDSHETFEVDVSNEINLNCCAVSKLSVLKSRAPDY